MQLINPEIRIENTNLCNATCETCPREKMTRRAGTMPVEHFNHLVDQAKAMGVQTVSIFGYGEPLMDKLLVAKVRYCTNKKLDTFVTTNASLLDPTLADNLLDAGLKHIRFSVHGIAPVAYERVHQGLDWIHVIRNVFNFIAINNKQKNKCKVSVTVIPRSGERLEHIVDFWGDKVDYLEIWEPHNWVGGRHYRVVQPKKKTCGRMNNGPIQVQFDGTVIPCCFLTNSEIVLGDTYKDSIEDILKGEQYYRLRGAHKTGQLAGYACYKCDQLNEGDSPLLYSSRDGGRKLGHTSSIKFNLEGE